LQPVYVGDGQRGYATGGFRKGMAALHLGKAFMSSCAATVIA
jgi:hypothetical protein